jgi:hypothetical protein
MYTHWTMRTIQLSDNVKSRSMMTLHEGQRITGVQPKQYWFNNRNAPTPVGWTAQYGKPQKVFDKAELVGYLKDKVQVAKELPSTF